jgi:hypothetical protein
MISQMYVYNDYWKANKSILLYPSEQSQNSSISDGCLDQCSIGKLHILEDKKLNDKVGYDIDRF